MATKEDILEQIVEEFLLHKGYFVCHNVKFSPPKDRSDYVQKNDCVPSDIDVIGFNPKLSGHDKVWVVSCKSWQGGFHPNSWLEAIKGNKTVSGRKAWKSFRELACDKWADGFVREIRARTGHKKFKYVVAATHVVGDKSQWQNKVEFRRRMDGNPIKIMDLKEMISEILPKLTTTPAATEVGRMLQLFKAA